MTVAPAEVRTVGTGRVAGWRPGPSSAVAALGALTLGLALGGSGRLSYHEAIEGQVAREMLASGDWVVPTLGGRPWLEKPPLAYGMVAGLGRLVGRVDEAVARAPAALAGALTALAVAILASRRYGPGVGRLAGLVQVSAAWLVTRGRLAGPDVPLAAVIAWALVAFDGLRAGGPGRRRWRWAFFALLGATAGLKGVGFGAALIVVTLVIVIIWDRDRRTLEALAWPKGWLLAAAVGGTWPALVLARHPEAWALWVGHVADRLGGRPSRFAGEPWWEYATSPLVGMLPWTPLAIVGAWRSWGRARRALGPGGPDRLLWAWALGPGVLVSLASARNSHYLVHALPPGAIWAALGLSRLGERLRGRGWPAGRVRSAGAAAFLAVGLAWGLGYAVLGPWLDGRGKGAEWAFYERVGRMFPPGEPVVLLYDAPDRPDRWDRAPYPTPFGPVPPDLAVRLFYLDRPGVTWAFGPEALVERPGTFAVVARARDEPTLRGLGRVELVAGGPSGRWDRAFGAYRVAGKRSLAEAQRPPGKTRSGPGKR